VVWPDLASKDAVADDRVDQHQREYGETLAPEQRRDWSGVRRLPLALAENLRVIRRWLERPYLFVFPAIGVIAALEASPRPEQGGSQ
jgi:hypothetical protein